MTVCKCVSYHLGIILYFCSNLLRMESFQAKKQKEEEEEKKEKH